MENLSDMHNQVVKNFIKVYEYLKCDVFENNNDSIVDLISLYDFLGYKAEPKIINDVAAFIIQNEEIFIPCIKKLLRGEFLGLISDYDADYFISTVVLNFTEKALIELDDDFFEFFKRSKDIAWGEILIKNNFHKEDIIRLLNNERVLLEKKIDKIKKIFSPISIQDKLDEFLSDFQKFENAVITDLQQRGYDLITCDYLNDEQIKWFQDLENRISSTPNFPREYLPIDKTEHLLSLIFNYETERVKIKKIVGF